MKNKINIKKIIIIFIIKLFSFNISYSEIPFEFDVTEIEILDQIYL